MWAAMAAGIAALTALITLCVAIATFRTASATSQSTEATRASATATERAAKAAADGASATLKEAEASLKLVEVSRQQIRRAQMPVVMPIAAPDALFRPGGASATGRIPNGVPASDDQNASIITLPISNVGTGPAFTIQATVEFLNPAGQRTDAGQPMTERAAVLTALGAGQEAILRARFRGLALPFLPFAISIIFDDAFGGSYEASGTYFPEQAAYRDVVFRPPRELAPT